MTPTTKLHSQHAAGTKPILQKLITSVWSSCGGAAGTQMDCPACPSVLLPRQQVSSVPPANIMTEQTWGIVGPTAACIV
jgi:hypothetical protein